MQQRLVTTDNQQIQQNVTNAPNQQVMEQKQNVMPQQGGTILSFHNTWMVFSTIVLQSDSRHHHSVFSVEYSIKEYSFLN